MSVTAVMLNPEVVKTFLASLASLLSATKTWLELRDRKAAQHEAKLVENLALSDPMIVEQAKKLVTIVPAETLELIMQRYKKCYDRFNEMLKDEESYFPDDIDSAAKAALPKCVCRALSVVRDVVGALPNSALEQAWSTYKCEVRLKGKRS